MTSLSTLIVSFAVVGGLLTWLTRTRSNNLLVSFLQHFCGVWFIFSGAVKAVDPIGTAYKMEEYFGHFETTAAGLTNFMKGLAPLFPWLAKHSEGFAIFMVALEIVLGVMLIVGWRRKFTAWLFFLIVVFFTLLTGFTYLTGYVPTEANFFDFAKWGPYVKAQMRATDCGCFGDFLKLDPRVSFFKDLGLMIPALIFLFRSKWMHQLFTSGSRGLWVAGTSVVTLLFCLYNTYYDLPLVDFRPFKVGANIREQKKIETSAKTDLLGWVLTNKNTGEVVTYMEPEPNKYTYMKQYPKDQGWSVKDQIQTDLYILDNGVKKPITKTKISDFAVEDGENGEVTDDLLEEKGYSLMIVAFHLEGTEQTETITVQDTTWASDTLRVSKDSISVTRRVAGITPRSEQREMFVPSAHYGGLFSEKINPLAEAALAAKWRVYAITSIADSKRAGDLALKTKANYPFYKADDKLLKTITRSNPGIVVLKDGQIVGQYHWRHLPSAAELVK
jgi:uncharacterized membrane protein YphA (DoxX/SURF4 family)